MTIYTELTQQDYLDYAKYQAQITPRWSTSHWFYFWPFPVWFGLCFLTCLLSDSFDRTASTISLLWLGAIIMPAIHLFALYMYSYLSSKKRLNESERKGHFGPRQVTISPEEITDSYQRFSITMKWSRVEKIVVFANTVYIHMGEDSVSIIAKRAFESEVAFNDFIAEIQSYYDQSRTLT